MSDHTLNGMGSFTISVNSEGNGPGPAEGAENPSPARIDVVSQGTDKLTAAGVVAILARANTYYDATTTAKLLRLTNHGFGFKITDTGATFNVLAADVAAWVTNLQTDLQLAANVGKNTP